MANGAHQSVASNRVVDFVSYKREQHQRRLNFESAPPPPTSSFERVTPFRPLTERAVRHRERMMRHLAGK